MITPLLNTTQRRRVQHTTVKHSTVKHSTAPKSTAEHSTAQHSAVQHSTAQHSTAQHHFTTAAQHGTAQLSTAQLSTAPHSSNTMHHSRLTVAEAIERCRCADESVVAAGAVTRSRAVATTAAAEVSTGAAPVVRTPTEVAPSDSEATGVKSPKKYPHGSLHAAPFMQGVDEQTKHLPPEAYNQHTVCYGEEGRVDGIKQALPSLSPSRADGPAKARARRVL